MTSRKNKLSLSKEEQLEFAGRLATLCAKFNVTIEADEYCGTPFVKLKDEEEDNWNVMEIDLVTGCVVIQEKDFWED